MAEIVTRTTNTRMEAARARNILSVHSSSDEVWSVSDVLSMSVPFKAERNNIARIIKFFEHTV